MGIPFGKLIVVADSSHIKSHTVRSSLSFWENWPKMDRTAAQNARESLDLAFSISNFLQTGLDRHTLSVLIALCEHGVNPEALAAVVKELRREAAALHQNQDQS